MLLIRYFSIKANQRRENVSFRCETSNGFPPTLPRESLLNARNHSQSLCWLAAGWVKECRRRYSAVTSSSPAPPGHLASVSHPMGRITGHSVLVNSGRCLDSFVTTQTRNNEFSDLRFIQTRHTHDMMVLI